MGLELGNLQLQPAFEGAKVASQLPVDVQKLLGITKYVPYNGAYPVK